MQYNNKLELIEAITSSANLFIGEYSEVKETFINIIDEEIAYSLFQMLAFCIGGWI